MKKIMVLLCCFNLVANAGVKQPTEFDQFIVKFSLHEIADPFNTAIQFAIEYKPSWRFGLQAECGYHAFKSYWPNDHLNESFMKYKVRGSWFYVERKKINMYAGIDFLYLPKTYQLSRDVFRAERYFYNFDHAKVNKKTFGFFLVDGLNIKSWGKIRFDISINAGLRITVIDYSDFVNPTQAIPPKDPSFPFTYENYEGMHYYPHVGLGMRLGYVLSSKKNSH